MLGTFSIGIRKEKVKDPWPHSLITLSCLCHLDFIHGYARVYCGEQQSSWHGTTIQIIHPQPHNLSSPTDMNVTVSMTDVTNSENEVFNMLPDTLSKRPHLTLSPRKTTLTCSPCPKKKGTQGQVWKVVQVMKWTVYPQLTESPL